MAPWLQIIFFLLFAATRGHRATTFKLWNSHSLKNSVLKWQMCDQLPNVLCILTKVWGFSRFFLSKSSFLSPFVIKKMDKLVLTPKNMILNSEPLAKHPFAGQNTQHKWFRFGMPFEYLPKCPVFRHFLSFRKSQKLDKMVLFWRALLIHCPEVLNLFHLCTSCLLLKRHFISCSP